MTFFNCFHQKEETKVKKKKNMLQLPQGTESFHLEEAFIHNRVRRALDDLYTSWGFLPVQVPVFDFFDNYRQLLSSEDIEKIYRLVDREGDLLMLRSDITLFLAKQVGISLAREKLPLRICYADTILRHQNREDISKNEFFQTGAELIGKQGTHADLEIIVLLLATLNLLDLPGTYLHLGSRALFSCFFDGYSQEDRLKILTSIVRRDHKKSEELISSHIREPELCHFLIDLFGFIGTGEELEDFKKSGTNKGYIDNAAAETIDTLIKISRTAESVSGSTEIRIDLSEVGNMPYHTGVVFQVYMQGLDSAVASGGRYDELLGKFGFQTPSVGFSLLLRKVEPFIRNKQRFQPPREVPIIEEETFIGSFRKAEEIRKKGGVAVL